MAVRARSLSAWALLALGCGPNYRYAYDGEAAFERCYALDFDGSVTPADRAGCWTGWLNAYAYGASPDRIDYARTRLTASNQPAAPAGALPIAGPPAARPAFPPAAPIVANAPTQPAPPAPPPTSPAPADLPRTPPPATTPSTVAPGEPPGASCANECRSNWSACGGRCTQRDAACEARCDDVYRDCVRGCY